MLVTDFNSFKYAACKEARLVPETERDVVGSLRVGSQNYAVEIRDDSGNTRVPLVRLTITLIEGASKPLIEAYAMEVAKLAQDELIDHRFVACSIGWSDVYVDLTDGETRIKLNFTHSFPDAYRMDKILAGVKDWIAAHIDELHSLAGAGAGGSLAGEGGKGGSLASLLELF